MCVVSVTDAKGLGVRPAHQHALLPAITFAPAAFSYVQGGTGAGEGLGGGRGRNCWEACRAGWSGVWWGGVGESGERRLQAACHRCRLSHVQLIACLYSHRPPAFEDEEGREITPWIHVHTPTLNLTSPFLRIHHRPTPSAYIHANKRADIRFYRTYIDSSRVVGVICP